MDHGTTVERLTTLLGREEEQYPSEEAFMSVSPVANVASLSGENPVLQLGYEETGKQVVGVW